MKIILGLVKPRSRRRAVRRAARSLALPTPQIVRRGIGSVPEARRLFGAMTVRENLLMGAYMRNDRAGDRRRSRPRADAVPAPGASACSQRAGTLSGGEQQMVAMARALMGRPAPDLHGRADHGPVAALRRPGAGADPRRSTGRASPSSWSSRTPAWRSRSPIAAMCCRPAASCSKARPPISWSMPGSATPISAARRRA